MIILKNGVRPRQDLGHRYVLHNMAPTKRPPTLLISDIGWIANPIHPSQEPHKAEAEAKPLRAGKMVLSTAATDKLEAEPLRPAKWRCRRPPRTRSRR